MLKIYRWRGHTYQIAEEDLDKYPGAVPVEKEKKKTTKSRRSPKNK